MSGYDYVGSNPLSFVDPNGLQAAPPIVLPGGAAAGAGAGAGTGAGALVDPIAVPGDPGGGDGNQYKKCERMLDRIENLKKEIYQKRYPDLASNPNGLPQRIGPGELLRDTIRGHEILLTIKLRQLKNLEAQFERECSCFMADSDAPDLLQELMSEARVNLWERYLPTNATTFA